MNLLKLIIEEVLLPSTKSKLKEINNISVEDKKPSESSEAYYSSRRIEEEGGRREGGVDDAP